ncbi:hypothetical protein ACI8AF_04600 [Blastococcus sp. SYSU D00669]
MPMAPVRAGDELITTIAPRARARLLAGVYAGCAAGMAVIVALLAPESPWGLVIVGPLVVLFAVIAVRHARELTHRTVLTSSQLVHPGRLRGWRTVELADVVSVVLHREADHEAGVEWELRIATADGSSVALPVDEHPRLLGWAPSRSNDPGAEREWRAVRDGGGGLVAVIAAQVRAVQGPDGPFARPPASG